jgi:hypothetical protein
MGGPATLFSNPPSLEEKAAKSPSIGARGHELNLRVLNELNGPMWSRDAILDEAAASLAEEKRTPSKKAEMASNFLATASGARTGRPSRRPQRAV